MRAELLRSWKVHTLSVWAALDADVRELERDDLKPVGDGAKFWVLTWCVTRL